MTCFALAELASMVMPAWADSLMACFHGEFSTVDGPIPGRWIAMVLVAGMLLQLGLNWHKNSHHWHMHGN
jgi:hypothetical protein